MIPYFPLVRVEKEWLEAIEELNAHDPELYRELLTKAIRKAAGENVPLSVDGFSDKVCQRFWDMTEITVADKVSKTPGYIRPKREK